MTLEEAIEENKTLRELFHYSHDKETKAIQLGVEALEKEKANKDYCNTFNLYREPLPSETE